jgi:hypothetical protein
MLVQMFYPFDKMHKHQVTSHKFFIAIVGGLVFGLSLITASGEQNEIDITFMNFKKTVHSEFIIVNKHFLVMRGNSYCDDAVDHQGNYFYFYMVDFTNGLKAYITKKELAPDKQLMKDFQEETELREFTHDILKNIEEDGGIEKIINSFTEGKKNFL